MKLSIIIPFRPASESANWKLDLLLLERTINSILRFKGKELTVFVIASETIPMDIQDNRLHIVALPFTVFDIKELDDYDKLLATQYNELYLKRHLDKSRKIMWGCKLAKDIGSDYMMSVDSDDLLSYKIIPYVLAYQQQVPGWYISKGYIFYENSRKLVKIPKDMNLLNGSTHIIHTSLVKIPAEETRNWQELNFFTDHGYLKYRIKEYDRKELVQIPFYGIVYSRTGISNISESHYKKLTTWKKWVKDILYNKFLDKEIIHEFQLDYKQQELRAFLL